MGNVVQSGVTQMVDFVASEMVGVLRAQGPHSFVKYRLLVLSLIQSAPWSGGKDRSGRQVSFIREPSSLD